MSVEFKLPELGENITEAEVAELLVSEGDQIEAEQNVVELETEKAVVELPCPHAGTVAKVHVTEGATIKVGDVVLTIDEGDEGDAESKPEEDDETKDESQDDQAADDSEEQEKDEDEEPEKKSKDEEKEKPEKKKDDAAAKEDEKKAAKPQADQDDGTPPPAAGPATRLLAKKLGVDLRNVTGSGPNGRIVQEDVEEYVHDEMTRKSSSDGGGGSTSTPKLPDFSKFGEVEREKLSKLNRTASDQLSRSWRVIPHVTQHEVADVTDLEAARKQFLSAAAKDTPKITMTAIAVKAVAQLLKEFPRFNSSLDADAGELVLKKYVNIGIAVDTEAGLVVPVIRDADEKTLRDVAGEMIELAEKARERKLSMDDMQGATFTITNLGGIGGTQFTPIVNWPEVAILGMSRYQKQPALVEGQLRERLMLPLSMSYDHRVINGADAARLIVRLANILQSAFALLADS